MYVRLKNHSIEVDASGILRGVRAGDEPVPPSRALLGAEVDRP